MDFKSRVSIVIPVYNGSNYLREAIDSALAQTYPNIEVIVVNDGSNDEGRTEEIAKSYGDKIRYFYKENGGVASALNLGIREMTGEYFSWLSHDDMYYPYKVERQVAYLSTQRNDVILYSDYDLIDHNSKHLSTQIIDHISPSKFRLALITGNPIHGCTVMIPRSCFEKIGLFDESLKTTQDYDLWFKIAAKYQFVHIQETLIKSRIHSHQGSVTMGPLHMEECNNYFIKCLNEISSSESITKNSFPTFFFRCALNLKGRGYLKASRYSMDLFLQGAKNNSYLIFIAPVLTVYYSVYNKKLGCHYWSGIIRKMAKKVGLLDR